VTGQQKIIHWATYLRHKCGLVIMLNKYKRYYGPGREYVQQL